MAETTGKHKIKSKELFTGVFQQDIDNISLTWESFDPETFDMAIRILTKARHIYIVALRESMILGEYLRVNLNRIFSGVSLVSTSCSSEIPEQLLHVSEKDAVIGISFPDYSVLTLKAMEFANLRRAQIITLTDDSHCPITIYSSCNLYAASHMSSVTASLTAAMSYINALIAALYVRNAKTAAENQEILCTFKAECETIASDEINRPNTSIEFEQLELKL